MLSLTDAPVTVYKSTKVGTYFENKQNLVVIGIFTNQNKPKTLEIFQMGKHANLEGSKLSDRQKEKVQELFTRHQQVFSRNSNDLGYCDKIKHQIKLNKDAQTFRRSYCSMSFDKKNNEKNCRRSRGCKINWTNPFALGSTINIGEEERLQLQTSCSLQRFE